MVKLKTSKSLPEWAKIVEYNEAGSASDFLAIRIGNMELEITRTDECVTVEFWPAHDKWPGAITTATAYFSEIQETNKDDEEE